MKFKVLTSGTYSILIDHAEGIFSSGSQAIYVKDNLSNTYHNLSTGAYTFTSDAGTFANRFEIVYQTALSNDVVDFAGQTPIYTVADGAAFAPASGAAMDAFISDTLNWHTDSVFVPYSADPIYLGFHHNATDKYIFAYLLLKKKEEENYKKNYQMLKYNIQTYKHV